VVKVFRIALLLVVVAISASAVPPAHAGGWAVTVLDPLPERIESDRTYTIGYWVLQHGSHPYEGDLGETGLRLVDEKGRSVAFEGVRLREPAHFAAAIAIPGDGTWRLFGVQGIFGEYEVGRLTVPGRLAVLPAPAPISSHDHDHAWGLIRPPQVAAGAHSEAAHTHPLASDAAHAASPAQQTSEGQPEPASLALPPVVSVGSAVALLGLLLCRRRLSFAMTAAMRRVRRHTS
jgi:hypothetical protein